MPIRWWSMGWLMRRGRQKRCYGYLQSLRLRRLLSKRFDRWDVTPLGSALAERLDWQDYGNEWNGIGNAIRAQNIDMQQEGKNFFFAAFIGVVKRSQTPERTASNGDIKAKYRKR